MTALYSIDELRAAHAAGHRIQANRGTDGARRWVDLTNPEFTCPAHLYRIAPAVAKTEHDADPVAVLGAMRNSLAVWGENLGALNKAVDFLLEVHGQAPAAIDGKRS